METRKTFCLTLILLSMVITKSWAYDIAVENADGVTIYYNYINDGKELSVTFKDNNFNSYNGSVVIPEDVIYSSSTHKVTSIGNYAFNNCNGLTSIKLPNCITKIGDYSFDCCKQLANFTFPSSLSEIGALAFNECVSLTSIEIPNSVTKIGNHAFYFCTGLTFISIPENLTSIEAGAFGGCNKLTSIIIPNSVTTIGSEAFYQCYGLTSVIIPNSVNNIGYGAFYSCRNLISVTIGTGVTRIGDHAFYNCKSLPSITIPNNVTFIGEYAFGECNNLLEIISKIEDPFEIHLSFINKSFENYDYIIRNATLYVPEGTIEKYRATRGWKDFYNIKEGIPTSITNLGYNDSNELKRYTIDGRTIKNPQKGINIIQMDNGTTKKVIVK